MTSNKGQKLFKKAKKFIPGGTMLLSKNPDMHLPNLWPSYFSKSKGCNVWDLDGNKFIDMSIMGVGTNSLGYGNKFIDEAVRGVVSSGNMSTLNCPEEVYLAEKLIEINPWASMVRFARTGGEANAIAIRIARASSGREKVAICGYHGWHDWYLSANHNLTDNLSDHLLPGLKPKGVPTSLKDTVYPFSYNNFDQLSKIVSNNEIGVIKMEVVRNFEPENNFLQKVRDLATKKGIVLIFDECTSGFRETNSGIYKKYNVNPDIVIYGKTLGNGYAITSIVGTREVMESAQDTFISSTFWTERIGPTAALKTLQLMSELKSWEIITSLGNQVRQGWKMLSNKYNISIELTGIPALSNLSFKSKYNLKYKTLIAQEMLTKRYLAGTTFYASTAHTKEIISKYIDDLEPVFYQISQCEEGILDIKKLLNVPEVQSGFKRLN